MAENLLEDMIAKNFLTWERNQICRSRKDRFSNKTNSKRSTLRHIKIKMVKIKIKKES